MTNGKALERLEKAGTACRDSLAHLEEAAATIAAKIIGACPVGVQLPRAYRIDRVRTNVGSELFLTCESSTSEEIDWIDGYGGYLHGDFNSFVPGPTRRGLIQFASDIRSGLLNEIADWLEKREAEARECSAALNGGTK